jgi:hypothetical protein
VAPSDKRGENKQLGAYNCSYVALERIDDFIDYLNSLEIRQTLEGIFQHVQQELPRRCKAISVWIFGIA